MLDIKRLREDFDNVKSRSGEKSARATSALTMLWFSMKKRRSILGRS